jgi:uncharacterized protein
MSGALRQRPRHRAGGWRRLGVFWAVVLALLGAGGGLLQLLGPPPPQPVAPSGPTAPPPAATAPPVPGEGAPAPAAGGEQRGGLPAPAAAGAAPKAPETATTSPPGSASGSASTGTPSGPSVGLPPGATTSRPPHPVTGPDAALIVPAPGLPGRFLPQIGPGGRMPMATYAAAFDAADPHPRVGLILAGVGLDHAASLAAIRSLPAGVTLAISPYARHPDALLAAARAAGHEYLVSLPMEPQGFPLNDPGNHALMTSRTPAQNRQALDWALSRFAGYVGATGALGILRGERFAGSAEDMDPVLRQLAARGLLYVDPRPGAGRLPFAWGRDVDVVIDRTADAAAIDTALQRLDQIARRRGHALGLVGAVRPVAVAQLAAWAHALPAQGLALAPVTALALAPPAAATPAPATPAPASNGGASKP